MPATLIQNAKQVIGDRVKQVRLAFLMPAIAFLWPLVVLFPYIIPVKGRYLGIGNDFTYLYYNYKVYLLDCLSRLRIPLWSPSEAAGFAFYSNPFAQTFYPFNIFLAAYYRLAGGYTALDHQRFTVLGVSLFSLGLYLWLRQLKLPPRSVLFATLVMSLSFKVTEILRFPNAVHTAAWYPWILMAITKILCSESTTKAVRYGLLLVFCMTCLLTGGYVYFVYYSLFLFGPYLLLFLIPKLRHRLMEGLTIHWARAMVTSLVAGLLSIALCGPYLYEVSALLKQTTDRAGGSFEYATAHMFNLEDTLGSLVFPPMAQTEGWYYFGILGLLLVIFYLLDRQLGRSDDATEVQIPPRRSGFWVKAFFLVWIGTISYITYGRQSYLFVLLWRFLPFFSSLRVWGRLNIILVPIIAWLVAIAYNHFEAHIVIARTSRGRRKWIAILSIIFVLILGVQLYAIVHRSYDLYWTEQFIEKRIVGGAERYPDIMAFLSKIPSGTISDLLASTFIVFGIISFFALLLFMVLAARGRLHSPRSTHVLLLGLVLFSALELEVIGPWVWIGGFEELEGRSRLNVERINQASFSTPRTQEPLSTISLEPAFSVETVPNWYFDRYNQFLRATEGEASARRELLGMIDGTRLYFSEAIDHAEIQPFLDDAARFEVRAQVVSYTGDDLVLDAVAPVDGYLSFIDNWDPDWEAAVDDEPVPIDLLFGTFKSVRLSSGEHRVVFAYRPKLFYSPGRK
ncbi:MAG: hypothetical protein JXA14_14390 [Anaerolineae bacterium]|nr:hypothetical protein [Anaerolineae bacterium]